MIKLVVRIADYGIVRFTIRSGEGLTILVWLPLELSRVNVYLQSVNRFVVALDVLCELCILPLCLRVLTTGIGCWRERALNFCSVFFKGPSNDVVGFLRTIQVRGKAVLGPELSVRFFWRAHCA